ncbi:MAG: VOC family protein [Acidobacteriaceae bacterium]|nr:VOC family protein [Acidobacteriaceae bacterium]
MAFYEAIFGWKFQKWDSPIDYWLITTGDEKEPGINGGLMPRRDPAQPCVNTISVATLDETLTSVEHHGGTCVVPKMPIPGVGWLAYCKDTEGHIFGVMQSDPAAR